MMGYGVHPFYGNGGGLMMLGMLLFLVVLLILVFLGFKAMQKTVNPPNNQTNVVDILKERLAKGEITEEEYDRLFLKLK
ncbi:SHOCT domain-containing protein [Ectobacillus sp. sgz5001026]|uniref:SHOCT domain-containing protein n=1 Tax=Ectobacillus sp. sgz5001026 TaxID=3242473 RepID=UPI0036D402CA